MSYGGVEYCVLCGKELPCESGKQYCIECEERYKAEESKGERGYGDKAKSEK